MKLAQDILAVFDDIYAEVVKGTLGITELVKDNNHIIRKHLPRVADIGPKKPDIIYRGRSIQSRQRDKTRNG
jgi:hypothetical protein